MVTVRVDNKNIAENDFKQKYFNFFKDFGISTILSLFFGRWNVGDDRHAYHAPTIEFSDNLLLNNTIT